ncbi:ribonuclease H-like domain-containing protein [Hypoxylon sp. FL1150]|nr:ribonuclease H-like domain-containing protein [Hypoxylon sp. FL1150]
MASRESPDNESEDESRPRCILDGNRKFTILNTAHGLKNGGIISINSLFRLVPNEEDVARAKTAMGDGKDGVWTGTIFQASGSPTSIFDSRNINTMDENKVLRRFMIRRRHVPHVSTLKTTLLYTDGACRPHSPTDSTLRGGCSFVFNTFAEVPFFAMETKGYDGQPHPHTNDRAKLRAVVAALEYQAWWSEGWERIVIATDSEYVSKGATQELRTWAVRKWRTAKGREVANQDLWKLLSFTMKTYAEKGCELSFWKIPKEMNTVAAAAATLAATKGGGSDEYEEYTLDIDYLR